MKKLIVLLALVCLFARVDANAQARKIMWAEIGTDEGLGYKLPHLAFGVGIEKPIGRRFELQAQGSWSPDKKFGMNDGNSSGVRGRGIVWITPNIGAIAGIGYSHLWTGQYSKGGWTMAAGAVFGIPNIDMRWTVTYLREVGNGIASDGIETNRTQGVEVAPEMKMWPIGPFGTRLALIFDLLHGLNQGNPQCDGTFSGAVTCPRSSWNSGTAAVRFSFVLPKKDF